MCGLPQKAIDTAKEYTDKYGSKIGSSALYASMAAAYCDLEEYKTAKYYADKAFAIQGGSISGELAGVYGRLKKETE